MKTDGLLPEPQWGRQKGRGEQERKEGEDASREPQHSPEDHSQHTMTTKPTHVLVDLREAFAALG